MVDSASQIGGGFGPTDVNSFPESLAGAYTYNEGDIFLDLGAEGDSFDGTGGSGNVAIFGEDGNDTLIGGNNDEVLSGGEGDDGIDGGDGDNFLAGGGGDDNIVAGVGDDTIDGGTGGDTLDGGAGDNVVAGGLGDDLVFAGNGDDTLFGGGGNDTIDGFGGDDFMGGGSGDDTLLTGLGDDTMSGGSGDDVFYFDTNFGDDVISDLAPGDTILLENDINGSGIATPSDVIPFVTGGVQNGEDFTVITFGTDTIRIEGIDSADFIANIDNFVRVQ